MREANNSGILSAAVTKLREAGVLADGPELERELREHFRNCFLEEEELESLLEWMMDEVSSGVHDHGSKGWTEPSRTLALFYPNLILRTQVYRSVLRRVGYMLEEIGPMESIVQEDWVDETGKRIGVTVSFRFCGEEIRFESKLRQRFDPKVLICVNRVLERGNISKRLWLARGIDHRDGVGKSYILFFGTPEQAAKCTEGLGAPFRFQSP